MNKKVFLLFILLVLSLPHMGKPSPGGLIGNGRAVEEPIMGVAFTYPRDWDYLNSPNNIALNAPDETSFVTIQVSEDNRFANLEELKSFLETEFQNYVWSSHKLEEREGFLGKPEGITALSRQDAIEAYFDKAQGRALLVTFRTTEETLKEVFEIKATLKWK